MAERCKILDEFLAGAGITAKQAEQMVLEPAVANSDCSYQRVRFLIGLGHAFSQGDQHASEEQERARRFWRHRYDIEAARAVGKVFQIIGNEDLALRIAEALCYHALLSERLSRSPAGA